MAGEPTEPMSDPMETLLREISACTACAVHLPHGPRPVVVADRVSRIVIIGQAPGRKVHATGIPWNDPSGDNLRGWLGVDRAAFYDPTRFALVPMGFCFPGTGRSGDLPPRPECAPLWHPRVFAAMGPVQLTLLVGRYAQQRYLGDRAGKDLTTTVRGFRDHLPRYLPMPHPSPRNRLWLRRNPWFETELLPVLKEHVARILHN